MADATVFDSVPETRQEAEAWFDRVIRENRFTISVFFPLNGAILLVASAMGWLSNPIVVNVALPSLGVDTAVSLPLDYLEFNPLFVLVGTVVMRAPLIAGVVPTMGRKALTGVLALAGYAYAIEYVGVHTGLPYGEFFYGVELGPVVGGIPVALPVFFLPLVMNAYLLCLLLLGPRAARIAVRLPVVIATVLLMDVVLDPAAVALGFWVYPNGGAFYGVPLSNYAGWVLSATVAVAVLDWAFDREALLARLANCEFMLDDLVSFVILWGGINAWFGNWAAVVVAVALGVGLARTERFDSRLFRVPSLSGR